MFLVMAVCQSLYRFTGEIQCDRAYGHPLSPSPEPPGPDQTFSPCPSPPPPRTYW